jgi:ATP adenylyltransferase/5',5'''-P-1,P-4-tetraphosphate phosphorylase II
MEGEYFMREQLYFNTHIGRKKPESIINRETKCPFCNISLIEEVVAQEENIYLVKNKFPVLQDSFQTVLIEHDSCDLDLSTYQKEHLYRLIYFGLDHWQKMKASGRFKSVMFYKNHGPHSGGTIYHPHMQIIGLEKVDCQSHILMEDFKGLPILKKENLEFNLSTTPRMGFYEFNIILHHSSALEQLSDCIQIGTHYILNHFSHVCNSYNLFFYELDGKTIVKMIPRFVVSPIFVGYSIPQVAINLEEKIEQMKRIYTL